jgi:hypothetical protein
MVFREPRHVFCIAQQCALALSERQGSLGSGREADGV